jgi:hypothetical protein
VRDIFGLLTSLAYRGVYENGRPITSAEEILAQVGTTMSVNGFFSSQT